MHSQTSFETARGISDVELLHGQALVSVSNGGQAPFDMISCLRDLRDAGISLDFLKLAPSAFSFVIPEEQASEIAVVLERSSVEAKVLTDRSIITVSAPNIRDESGLVARIAEIVVRSGANIEQVGDMHSSVLIVLQTSAADKAAELLRDCIGKVEIL